MRRRSRRLAGGALFFALFLAPASALAQAAEPLAQLEERLAAEKSEAARLARAHKANAKKMLVLQAELDAALAEEVALRQRRERLARARQSLTPEQQRLKKAESEALQQLAAGASALIRLSRLPPEILLARPDAAHDPRASALLLRALVPSLEAHSQHWRAQLASIRSMEQGLTREDDTLARVQQQLRKERGQIAEAMAERAKLARTLHQQSEEKKQEMDALAARAADVRELLQEVALSAPPPPRRKQDAGLRLLPPVPGNIDTRYGERDPDGVEAQGVRFAAETGVPVRAPVPGKVVYAGPFRGYGQIVIVQGAGGEHVLLSGFARLAVTAGESVRAGDALGVAGADGLYLELRRGKETLDPQKFLG